MQAHIFGPPVVAGRVLWNRICQSFHPPIHLSRHFLGIGILVFSKFWLCVRKPDKVVFDRVRFFFKKKKKKKCTKNGENGPKKGFFEFIEKFGPWFFLNLVYVKLYIICYISVQILYLGNIWSLRCGPKFSWPIKLQNF